ARWEARRLDARRTRLAAALSLGHAAEVLPELGALCDAHPLDEPLQVLRLRALRGAGRAAEALAGYEEVRALLADRLGADPGPELRSLHAELLSPAPPLPERPPPAAKVSSSAGRADSSARPALEDTARRAESFAAATSAADAAGGKGRGGEKIGNLRTRLTSFIGREAEIEAIRSDLSHARLVTLLGPGGAGKTRLSQEAAEDLPVPDGVWLAELAPVERAADPEAIPEAILTALGARQTVLYSAGAEELRQAGDRKADDPLTRLTEHCARRTMVLLLDNCEHVVDAAARVVDHLLAHCPGLTVLATSREPLGVPGELVRPLDPLPEPAALRLFAERGAAARPDFRIEDDPAAAAEICSRLDGLPLAIELAAARLRMLTPRQIADRLDDRFRLLTGGSRTLLPRQQTLRAVVDWSWDLLDEPERAVLRRLSVFSGGSDLAAAEAVCGGSPTGGGVSAEVAGLRPGPPGSPSGSSSNSPKLSASLEQGGPPRRADLDPAGLHGDPACHAHLLVDRRDITDLLGSLIDKSLVVAVPSTGGEMRYRLLETVAEYAGERLDESADRGAAERAHLVHYRELARRTDPELRGPG
ncbi:BTAD domain-containing putative transcriptional regulator, partial [Streptomyces sp. T-3]|nr:BTAD domain-containing putative transcriptional regulator [Streptomyces sp. T-3]